MKKQQEYLEKNHWNEENVDKKGKWKVKGSPTSTLITIFNYLYHFV